MSISEVYVETITQIRDTTTKSLSRLTDMALGRAMLDIHQRLKTTGDEEKLLTGRPRVLERFNNYLLTDFNDLLENGRIRKSHRPPPTRLSLLDVKILETDVALMGMATHARNSEVNEYLRFTIRINAQFYNIRLDETNNPLDPGRLAEGFRFALLPVNLSGEGLLAVYRQFNSQVFHHLGDVMRGANELLKKTGVAPNLENLGRTRSRAVRRRGKRRGRADAGRRLVSGETAGDQPDEYLTQPLLLLREKLRQRHAEDPARRSKGNPVSKGKQINPDQQAADDPPQRPLRTLDRVQLLLLCERVALSRQESPEDGPDANVDATANTYVRSLLEQSIHNGELLLLDQECLDIVALIDLLFEVIESDTSVPAAPKALLLQSRLAVLRVALADPSFFDDGEHSLRVLLNEMATAGIAWTEHDTMDDDKVFVRVREALQSLIQDYDGDPEFVESLLEELMDFKEELEKKAAMQKVRMRNGGGSRDRLEEIKQYARSKIADRVLVPELPALITELLETHYLRFLVIMIIRDGPDGDSWEALMDTIDVLLWSVAPDKNEEDMLRLDKINQTLMSNLRRAFQIAGLTPADGETLLEQLRQLQHETVSINLDSYSSRVQEKYSDSNPDSPAGSGSQHREMPEEEHLLIVRKLKNDMWFEFGRNRSETVRCKLASRIPGIDRVFFVDRHGAKILERTETALAGDMRTGRARLINDGKLIDRAIEKVFTSLDGADESLSHAVHSGRV